MKKLIMALVVLVVVPALAQAQITNGRFETGNFSGWESIGDALVVDTSIGSTSPGRGGYQALITTAPGFPDPNAEHPQSYSGNDSVGATGLPSQLEFFLGLGPGSLNQFALSLQDYTVALEGSAIKQTFTANAGSILTFNWQFLTDEKFYLDPGFLIDFAFVVLDGNILFLADDSAGTHDSDTPFLYESGYRTFVVRLAPGGTHTIGVGVVDTQDPAVNSGLLLDNFRIVPAFAGTPGKANCHGKSVSALAHQFGGLSAAASALEFASVEALQDAIREFCEE